MDEEELIQEQGENTYLVEGSMKLDDINDALGTKLESEDYDSIGSDKKKLRIIKLYINNII